MRCHCDAGESQRKQSIFAVIPATSGRPESDGAGRFTAKAGWNLTDLDTKPKGAAQDWAKSEETEADGTDSYFRTRSVPDAEG